MFNFTHQQATQFFKGVQTQVATVLNHGQPDPVAQQAKQANRYRSLFGAPPMNQTEVAQLRQEPAKTEAQAIKEAARQLHPADAFHALVTFDPQINPLLGRNAAGKVAL